MECADSTEIVVHDGGTRLASLLWYNGPSNQIMIGRDKYWGGSNTVLGYLEVWGKLSCYLRTFYGNLYPYSDGVGVSSDSPSNATELSIFNGPSPPWGGPSSSPRREGASPPSTRGGTKLWQHERWERPNRAGKWVPHRGAGVEVGGGPAE